MTAVETFTAACHRLLWPERMAAPDLQGAGWLGSSLVQFVIWVLLLAFTGDWQGPWWLWSVVFGGTVAGGVWWFIETQCWMQISGDTTRQPRTRQPEEPEIH